MPRQCHLFLKEISKGQDVFSEKNILLNTFIMCDVMRCYVMSYSRYIGFVEKKYGKKSALHRNGIVNS